MTTNMHNAAPRGRRELDRDRDASRRSEAISAGRSMNSASMNLGRDPPSQANCFARIHSRNRGESG